MKISILLIFLLCSYSHVFSQGGSNVRYILIDSLDSTLTGQKIKIDFKGKETDKMLALNARRSDTVKLRISDREVDIIEVKGQGVDYWDFAKESIKSYTYREGYLLIIDDIHLLQVSSNAILVRMKLELMPQKKMKAGESHSESKDLWIPKGKIVAILAEKTYSK